jgi:predicted permease
MWFRKRSDQDFADEIAAHIDLETDRLIATGMSPADAHAAASRAFGNRTAVKERFHESRTRVPIEQLSQDLRYAARSMRRTPGFALVAVFCLAIGISVNTAAFSVLNALLFRDFPGIARQSELASILVGWETQGGRRTPENASIVDWDILRAGLPAFSGIAAFDNLQLSVRVSGEPQAMRGDLVSNNFFEVLGTRPAVGRFMTSGDDPRDLDQIVVISYRLWKRAFDGRPDIVGQRITIGTRPFSIIGVTPEGFFGLSPGEVIDPDVGAPEVFVPLAAARFVRAGPTTRTPTAALEDRWLQIFGRLRPGATLAEGEAQANAVVRRLAVAYPVERRNAFAVLHAGGDRPEDAAEMIGALLSAMAVPAIILLVACANLANQLLARAIQRGREIAVRLSLGASRWRVVRQLLVEAALLAIIASAVGVLLARWLLDALRAWALPIPFRIAVDARVMAFTIGLALVTALAFGLVPALAATRTDLSSALKDGLLGSGYRRSRLRNGLVVVQIAASLALIAISNTFVRVAQRPPSALDALENRVLLVSMNLDLLGFDSVRGRAYQTQVMDRLGHLPGVAAVGMAPFAMFDMLGGHPVKEPGTDGSTPRYFDLAEVSGAWFDATNTRPVRGRLFSDAERAAPPSVAVVDEEFARRMWGASEAIGRSLRIGSDSAPTVVTVVGVIPTRNEVTYRQAEGVVVLPGTRQYNPRTYFYIRTNIGSERLTGTVRDAVRALDRRVPILWIRTLEDVAAQEVSSLTMLASGLATLGAVALALAALGLFGMLSFIVAQRRHEIGIRMALGARRGDVTWMVLRQALGLGAGGVIAGTLVAVAVVALLRAVIHGLQPLNLPEFGAVAAIMVFVALLASAIPARRAASVDPMKILRTE